MQYLKAAELTFASLKLWNSSQFILYYINRLRTFPGSVPKNSSEMILYIGVNMLLVDTCKSSSYSVLVVFSPPLVGLVRLQ